MHRSTRFIALCALAAATVLPVTSGQAAASSHPADTADPQSCRLIQTWLNYSALNYGWAQGLEGCSGEVANHWQIGPTKNGPWTTHEQYGVYYDDEAGSYWVYEGDICNAWHRLTASYGGQQITTNAVLGTGEPC